MSSIMLLQASKAGSLCEAETATNRIFSDMPKKPTRCIIVTQLTSNLLIAFFSILKSVDCFLFYLL